MPFKQLFHVSNLLVLLFLGVFHHFFKQSQNESEVLNVLQDPKLKVLEKSDQNRGCSSFALLGLGAAKIGKSAVFGFNLFLVWSNFSFGPNFLKFWI